MYHAHKMAQLIADKIIGKELAKDDLLLLTSWLDASHENRKLYEKIKRGEITLQILELEQNKYGDRMAWELAKKMDSPKRNRRLYLWFASVAVASSVAVVALILTPFSHSEETTNVDHSYLATAEIVPGKVHAVLTLANGKSVEIIGDETEPKEKDNSEKVYNLLNAAMSITTADGVLSSDHLEYNTLMVPVGGEFFFSLPDGSKVWLNSKTELRFPFTFSGADRRVFLTGEAFFDVAKNREKAFIISLAEGEITVYGTRFNITAYEEAPISAVLLEGSIGFVAVSGKSVKLKPSQRMVYETTTDNILIKTEDPTPYTAWVDKMFIFKGQRLDEIMATLSRWYDVEITFDTEDIKDIRLSGQLYRNDDIGILLKTYEDVAGIKFNIEKKRITIFKEHNYEEKKPNVETSTKN